MFYIFIYLLFMFSAYGLGLLFLFKCDTKPSVKTLAKELYSNKASNRSDAILKLEDYGTEAFSVIPDLVKMLNDPSDKVKNAAEHTLTVFVNTIKSNPKHSSVWDEIKEQIPHKIFHKIEKKTKILNKNNSSSFYLKNYKQLKDNINKLSSKNVKIKERAIDFVTRFCLDSSLSRLNEALPFSEQNKLVKTFSKILSSAENNFISNAIICLSLFSKNIPEAKLELINNLQNKRINSLNRLQIAKSILLLEHNDLAINYVTKELKHRDLEIRQKAASILKEIWVEV